MCEIPTPLPLTRESLAFWIDISIYETPPVEKARGKRDVAPRPFSTRPRAVLWSRQPDPRTCSGTTTAHHLLSPLFLPPVDSMDSTTNGRHLGEALFSPFLHARTRTHNKIAPRFQTSPTGTHTHSPAPVPALCSLPPSPNFGEVEKVGRFPGPFPRASWKGPSIGGPCANAAALTAANEGREDENVLRAPLHSQQ
jgi:hypothetical protein